MARKPRFKVTSEFTEDEYAVLKAIAAQEDRTLGKQVRVWALPYVARVPRVKTPARKPKTK